MGKKDFKDFNHFMAQQLYKDVQSPLYCRICGKDLKVGSIENEKGSPEEMYNKMHYKCYLKMTNGGR